MTLADVGLTLAPRSLPPEVDALLREAGPRIARYLDQGDADTAFGFVPSDFRLVHAALAEILERHLAPGPVFCEWGSGFGVVAMTAALLGYEAHGIEIDDRLAREAQALARALDVRVDLVRGSFIPEGGEDLADRLHEFAWLRTDGESAYEALGLDVEDVDVVFAYPWPGEEETVAALFVRYAARGALLVTYEGREGIRVRRRTGRRR